MKWTVRLTGIYILSCAICVSELCRVTVRRIRSGKSVIITRAGARRSILFHPTFARSFRLPFSLFLSPSPRPFSPLLPYRRSLARFSHRHLTAWNTKINNDSPRGGRVAPERSGSNRAHEIRCRRKKRTALTRARSPLAVRRDASTMHRDASRRDTNARANVSVSRDDTSSRLVTVIKFNYFNLPLRILILGFILALLIDGWPILTRFKKSRNPSRGERSQY